MSAVAVAGMALNASLSSKIPKKAVSPCGKEHLTGIHGFRHTATLTPLDGAVTGKAFIPVKCPVSVLL